MSARAATPVCHGGGSLDKVSLSLSGEDAITPSHPEKSKCQLTDIVGVFGTIGNDASPRNAEQTLDHTAVGVDAEQSNKQHLHDAISKNQETVYQPPKKIHPANAKNQGTGGEIRKSSGLVPIVVKTSGVSQQIRKTR